MIYQPLQLRLFDWSGKNALGDNLLHHCSERLINEACMLENRTSVFHHHYGHKANILGGGTIFGHGVFFSGVARRVSFDRLPYTVFCSGVRNPDRPLTPKEYDRLNRFCQNSRGIGVRGGGSLTWLQQQGIKNGEIIGDAALSFVPKAVPELPGDFKIGISLRYMRGGIRKEEQNSTNKKNITLFAALCDTITARFGASLFFFDFCKNRFDDDGYAIEQVLAQMKNRSAASASRIFSFRENRDPLLAFSRLSRCDFIISQRLHPALISWISGIPAISLEYQFGKAADAFSSLELPEAVLDIDHSDIDQIIQRMNQLLSVKTHLLSNVSSIVDKLRQKQINFMRRFIREWLL
jgi:polysaccharide pyruvyl transferase WcaK-like protein